MSHKVTDTRTYIDLLTLESTYSVAHFHTEGVNRERFTPLCFQPSPSHSSQSSFSLLLTFPANFSSAVVLLGYKLVEGVGVVWYHTPVRTYKCVQAMYSNIHYKSLTDLYKHINCSCMNVCVTLCLLHNG